VILSSHILPIVEATCGRVILINRGEIIADDTIVDVIRTHGQQALCLRLGDVAQPQQVVDQLGAVEGIGSCTVAPGGFLLVPDQDDSEELRRRVHGCITDNGWAVLELESRSNSLEDVFRTLTMREV